MYNFNFYNPVKVLFGEGRLNDLHDEQLPGKKALICIGGQSVKKYGYLERLEKQLDMAGVEHVLFEGIRPNPTRQNVMDDAKAVGIENASSGKDFIKALDDLIAAVGCDDLKMSDAGITEEELKLYPAKFHEVLGGDITADPLPLSDEDYLTIYRNAWR